jgi:hypothetical protein
LEVEEDGYEDEDESYDESFSMQNDSFADIKVRKANVKPVSDLRKVAISNNLMTKKAASFVHEEQQEPDDDDEEGYDDQLVEEEGSEDEGGEEEGSMQESNANILDGLDSQEELEESEMEVTLVLDEKSFPQPIPSSLRTNKRILEIEPTTSSSSMFAPVYREAYDMN